MKKLLLVASTLLATVALPAAASNFYVIADAGQSKLSVDSESITDTAFSIGGGYKLNQTFAIEVAYRDLGEFEASYQENFGSDYVNAKVNLAFSALQASVVASFPVGTSGSVFGRLGIADLEIDASYSYSEFFDGSYSYESNSGSQSKNKAVFGVGYRHALNDKWFLHAEYNQYAKWEDFKTSSLTAGFSYQF